MRGMQENSLKIAAKSTEEKLFRNIPGFLSVISHKFFALCNFKPYIFHKMLIFSPESLIKYSYASAGQLSTE